MIIRPQNLKIAFQSENPTAPPKEYRKMLMRNAVSLFALQKG